MLPLNGKCMFSTWDFHGSFPNVHGWWRSVWSTLGKRNRNKKNVWCLIQRLIWLTKGKERKKERRRWWWWCCCCNRKEDCSSRKKQNKHPGSSSHEENHCRIFTSVCLEEEEADWEKTLARFAGEEEEDRSFTPCLKVFSQAFCHRLSAASSLLLCVLCSSVFFTLFF